MSQCETCRFAIMDYEEYYGGARQYFVSGCEKDLEPDEECEGYEEYRRDVE